MGMRANAAAACAACAVAAVLAASPLQAGSARAADYDRRPLPPRGRVVAVDELFLRAGGCPRNPDCIAPRVVPVGPAGVARAEALMPITIPTPRPVPFFLFSGLY